MDKKTSWLFVGGVIIILIIFPIITNALMFIKTYEVAGDSNTWIGFLGSFGGAIIGGVISGAITLVGVRLTIEHAEKNRMLEEYPKKINSIEKLIQSLEDILEEIEGIMVVEEEQYKEKNKARELQLFVIDDNLDIYPTERYKELTTKFLFKIKEMILDINTQWYKDFFNLREKLEQHKYDFLYDTNELSELWEEAHYYMNQDHSEEFKNRKEYVITYENGRFTLEYNRLVINESKLITLLFNNYLDFKHEAEKYQLKLMEFIE